MSFWKEGQETEISEFFKKEMSMTKTVAQQRVKESTKVQGLFVYLLCMLEAG